jgi:hypothetical protein
MQLVASVRQPRDLEVAVSTLVTAAGMTAAEARMRLAPEPPALLARLPPERAATLVEALGGAGLVALAIDESVPAESERFKARTFLLDDGAAHFTARSGENLTLPWDAVRVVLRGLRTARTTTEHTETTRKLSVGRAVLTGGLMMTRKTTSTVRGGHEDTEQFILVHAEAGDRVILAEETLEFSGLGPLLQPARTANMGVLAQELKRRAPNAFHDERLVRLGRRALPFVLGGEHTVRSGEAELRRTDTRGSVDVLAEVLDRAVRAGLLGHAGNPAAGR